MQAPPPRLAQFLAQVAAALPVTDPAVLVPALAALVARDDWLPPAYAQPGARYQQYLLWRDPAARASVVSFVWDRQQGTPIHDHGVWGLVGVLRGAETEQRYRLDPFGHPVAEGPANTLDAGAVARLIPGDDLHQVSNASAGVSVSIHVYGADIGHWPRVAYGMDGKHSRFVSGYANDGDTPPFTIGSS